MINFFRKIRQNLLSQNKFSKYLLYAFGEILLVVIGILIALQINNWNEHKKQKVQEITLLKQLKSDLVENQREIEELKERIEINRSAMDTVVVKLRKKEYNPTFDLLVTLIHRKSYFNNANSGYRLIGNGLAPILSNDSILNGVLQLYEKDFANIITRQNLMNTTIDNRVYPLTNRLFKTKPLSIKFESLDGAATDVFTPLNFESLSDNNQYINTLLQLKRIIEERLNLMDQTKNNVEKMILRIEEEIKLKSND
ncbi:DUF6090 family protein [Croceitalea marina]|uniref:DUF6090 family protein n=1 Tax=Croceitalea marina TaxID=1775166 RepID=A0ABW5MUD0_9FLAO